MLGRRPWTGLILALASIALTFVLVDLVLLAIHGPVRVMENFYEPAPGYGYRMRPNSEFLFASPFHGYRAVVRTNELGLRDDPITVPKPPRLFRVLLLGDSMTAGLEVAKNETFEAVCERQLSTASNTSGRVECINAGVRGYNLDNILGLASELVPRLQPDLVVYVFVDNDLTDDDGFTPKQTDASRGFSLKGVLGRIGSLSHLTYRLEILRQSWRLRSKPEQTPGGEVSVSSGLFALFTRSGDFGASFHVRTARRIAGLAQLASAHDAEFLLVGAPHKEEVDPSAQAWWRRNVGSSGTALDFDGVRRYLDWVASSAGLERLDPVPAFRAALAAAPTSTLWFRRDNHLNARGHAILASDLANTIEKLPSFKAWRDMNSGR